MPVEPPELLPLPYRSFRDERRVRAKLVGLADLRDFVVALMGLAALCSPCLAAVGMISGVIYGSWTFCGISAAATFITIGAYALAQSQRSDR